MAPLRSALVLTVSHMAEPPLMCARRNAAVILDSAQLRPRPPVMPAAARSASFVYLTPTMALTYFQMAARIAFRRISSLPQIQRVYCRFNSFPFRATVPCSLLLLSISSIPSELCIPHSVVIPVTIPFQQGTWSISHSGCRLSSRRRGRAPSAFMTKSRKKVSKTVEP